jgi:hypothetical protein
MSVTKTLASQLDKSICDGFGCDREAKIEVRANVGELGTIDLILCENCVPKFRKSIVNKIGKLPTPQESITSDRMTGPNGIIIQDTKT